MMDFHRSGEPSNTREDKTMRFYVLFLAVGLMFGTVQVCAAQQAFSRARDFFAIQFRGANGWIRSAADAQGCITYTARLETRQFTLTEIDPQGWVRYAAPAGTRVVVCNEAAHFDPGISRLE